MKIQSKDLETYINNRKVRSQLIAQYMVYSFFAFIFWFATVVGFILLSASGWLMWELRIEGDRLASLLGLGWFIACIVFVIVTFYLGNKYLDEAGKVAKKHGKVKL